MSGEKNQQGFYRMGQSAQKPSSKAQNTISPEIIENLKEALNAHQSNDLKAAKKLYETALSQSHHQPDVVNMAAIFYQQTGRHKYCLTLLQKALRTNPHHPKTHQLLAKSYLALNRFNDASSHFLKADQLAPGEVETLSLRGECHLRLGALGQALTCLEQAWQKQAELEKTDFINLTHNLSDACLLDGRRERACEVLNEALNQSRANYDTLIRLVMAEGESQPESLPHILNAFLTDPERLEAKVLFARFCEFGTMPRTTSASLKSLIMACLQSREVDHQSIALPWQRHALLYKDGQTAHPLYEAKTHEEVSALLKKAETAALLHDPFFIEGVRFIRADKPGLERLYTLLRHAFLTKITEGANLPLENQGLLASLAEQCFFNEFVFSETKSETSAIERLENKIEQAESLGQIAPEQLLILACYRPLAKLAIAAELARLKTSDHHLARVIQTAVIEPAEEQKRGRLIKSLSPIKDATSAAVRTQYEENPYPRWRSENRFTPPHAIAMDHKRLAKREVLIAGCGTGKQIISATNLYQNCHFTAIDISRASLGYAARKLNEFERDKNISLYHCDLLNVESLGKKFDYIECCGVLHHMQDPAAGLEALTGVLKPGGKLKLALYSKIARRSVQQARRMIAEQKLEPTIEGIRSCRQDLLKEYGHDPEGFPLPHWRDFYSTSECRDLIFHVQEICYTLEELNSLLQNAGLQFEKFSLPQPVLDDFITNHPQPGAVKDLNQWHDYEKNNPSTFIGMYQFWCHRENELMNEGI